MILAKRILKESYTEERAQFLNKLLQASREGHLCLEVETAPLFPESILQEGKELIPKTPIVKDGNRYYLQRNWVYETHILTQIKRLQKPRESELFSSSLPLLPDQQKAIEKALQNSFSIICGGPGTGKTYTASVLVRFLAAKKENMRVILAAPTGKAASHLKSVLGEVEAKVESTTLHRLLKITPGETKLFSKRKIDADLVIVDEASMIDIPLMAQLLEAISNETRLVLLGDPNQLPPVETGSLFAEMGALYGSFLHQSMRTENRPLLEFAEGINRGEWIHSQYLLNWSFDTELILKLYQAMSSPISAEEPDPALSLKQFRILGALRQGPFGIDALNQGLLEEMRRRIRPGEWWAIPIMVTVNRPLQELYNGTSGLLIGKSKGGLQLHEGTAFFPHPVPHKMIPPYEIAFCLSVHKSQGSEFDRVLALFPEGSENFGREALYTAITRAKKEVQIVASPTVLSAMLSRKAIQNSGFTARQT
jgi:exodeoxyribonuclease V alpha subunit